MADCTTCHGSGHEPGHLCPAGAWAEERADKTRPLSERDRACHPCPRCGGDGQEPVTCAACGATGSGYYDGHVSPYEPHPCFLSTGGEGRCDLCGGPFLAYLHTVHDGMEKR